MDASGSSAHDYTVFEGEHEYKRHTKGWILSTKFRLVENFARSNSVLSPHQFRPSEIFVNAKFRRLNTGQTCAHTS